MCFFDQHRFACGDWKWGHFRQHCAKEYRIGESCGMKLIMQTITQVQKCKLCEKIDTKMRRRAAEVDRINRWQREGQKFRASIDKSMDAIKCLDSEIYELGCERARRLQDIGTQYPVPATPALSLYGGEKEQDNLTKRNSDDLEPLSINQDNSEPQNPAKEVDFELSTQLSKILKMSDEPKASVHKHRMVNKRHVAFHLPITLVGSQYPATVLATPDTGADDNAISLSLAKALGLKIKRCALQPIKLATGSRIYCYGTVRVECCFGFESTSIQKGFTCCFQVFQNLVSPLIMSAPFLHQTKTLTTHRYRLIEIAMPILKLFKIRAMGCTTTRLRCSLNGENVLALPDTGSDVDLMSKRYATQRGFLTHQDDAWIRLADGSIHKPDGYCHVQLAVGFGASLMPSTVNTSCVEDTQNMVTTASPIDIEPSSSFDKVEQGEEDHQIIRSKFYIVENLVADVVVGVSSLESLRIYEEHSNDLVNYDRPVADLQQLNRIHLLPTVNEVRKSNSRVNGPSIRDMTIAEWLSAVDQEENARREDIRRQIAELGEEERITATRDENQRQAGFDAYRASLLRAIDSDSLSS